MSNSDLTEAKLIRSNFNGAKMRFSKLYKVNLKDAKLVGTILWDTDLREQIWKVLIFLMQDFMELI